MGFNSAVKGLKRFMKMLLSML